MNDIQKSVLSRSIKIRLDRGEDVVEVFKKYKNLTDNEKKELLGEFNLSPYEKSIDELKVEKIVESKEKLSAYLENNPLVTDCHDNKIGIYTITEEKRNMFTSKFTAHMALVQAGIEDVMTWNETGKACEVWTDNECIVFIAQWNNITTALVKYQQDVEIEINSCEDIESVKAITIDYSSADPRNI